MAHDEGLAQMLRDDLAGVEGITERRMFGALCLFRDGHLLCGAHGDGVLYRVGKAQEEAALRLPGAAPMLRTGRRMGGFIDVGAGALADDDARAQWLAMALAHAAGLPKR